MSFIPADGNNYETANAFTSVEYADSYHSLRGNTSWTGTDAEKQAAIVKATDYVEQVYGQRFIGNIVNFPQSLSWPRYTSVYDDNIIPETLKKAVCELALEALTTTLSPNLSRDSQIKREKVDVLEVEYTDAAPMPTIRPVVTGYLSRLLTGSGLNVPVVRV